MIFLADHIGQRRQKLEWIQTRRSGGKGWIQPNSAQQILLPNAPSIPSHNNVFGYEENEKGELIKQQNSEKVHAGIGVDTVGPGHYQLVKPKKKIPGPVVQWKPAHEIPKKI